MIAIVSPKFGTVMSMSTDVCEQVPRKLQKCAVRCKQRTGVAWYEQYEIENK